VLAPLRGKDWLFTIPHGIPIRDPGRIPEGDRNSELTRNTRPVHKALLKYGHDNFILEILEYCKNTELLEREQYYLYLLNPEYNILKHAYSMLGFKHSEDNIALFKQKQISPEHREKLSFAHKGKMVSKETREKLSHATAQYKKNNPLSVEALANIKAKTAVIFYKNLALMPNFL